MGLDEIQVPINLPDCRDDAKSCEFPINREAALRVAFEQVVKGRNLKVLLQQISPEYKWEGRTYSEGHWYGEYFAIDLRTGEVSGVRQNHRID